MNFEKLAVIRRSVRKFLPEKIEDDKLKLLLEAARNAPTAVNFQPFRIYIIRNPEIREKINESYPRNWFVTAPLVFVVVGLHNKAWKRRSDGKDHTDIDVAIVIDHITLQAADIGLGTCWVCNFDPLKCREALNLNEDEEPVALVPVGYPDPSEIFEKRRKELDDLVIWL